MNLKHIVSSLIGSKSLIIFIHQCRALIASSQTISLPYSLRSGIADVRAMLDKKIKVGLGTGK